MLTLSNSKTMASTSTSLSSPFRPFLSSHRIGFRQAKRVSTMACASRNEAHDQNYYGGRIVDENLIVLRKRIHEMTMVERNYEPPSNWMEWEKNCYAGYDEFICEAVGLLQSQLMNTRPSLALGLAALIALSVPTSTALVWFHLMEMTKGILGGVNLI